MKIEELKSNPIVATVHLFQDMENSKLVAQYVNDCLNKMFIGDYGITPKDDVASNNEELANNEGSIMGHYKAIEGMKDDIFIVCNFSASAKGNDDYNHTTAMYCFEY